MVGRGNNGDRETALTTFDTQTRTVYLVEATFIGDHHKAGETETRWSECPYMFADTSGIVRQGRVEQQVLESREIEFGSFTQAMHWMSLGYKVVHGTIEPDLDDRDESVFYHWNPSDDRFEQYVPKDVRDYRAGRPGGVERYMMFEVAEFRPDMIMGRPFWRIYSTQSEWDYWIEDEAPEPFTQMVMTPVVSERILCAANWYDDGQEHIHQPRNIETGVVVCGHRHHNCIGTYVSLTGTRTANDRSQGFLTNLNRYVSREEGWRIAYAAGQINEDEIRRRGAVMGPEGTLYSEDMW